MRNIHLYTETTRLIIPEHESDKTGFYRVFAFEKPQSIKAISKFHRNYVFLALGKRNNAKSANSQDKIRPEGTRSNPSKDSDH